MFNLKNYPVMHSPFFFLSLFLGIGSFCCLLAQNNPISPLALPDKMVEAKIRIYCEPSLSGSYRGIETKSSIAGLIGVAGKEFLESKKVDLQVNSSKNLLNYKGSPTFSLYKLGELLPKKKIASCELDLEWKSVFIVMIPNMNGGYYMKPINLGDEAFVSGTAQLINFSAETLSSNLGGSTIITEANGTNLISLKHVKSYEFRMLHAIENKNKPQNWRLIVSKNVNARSSDRVLIYIYRKFGNRGPWNSKIILNP